VGVKPHTMPKPLYLFSISSHPKAISINSLDVTFLRPKINFSKYDYLIITSKQTSEALKQYKTQDYISKAALCVSKQSALSFEKLGGKVLDIGGGYGDNLVSHIKSYPKNTKWLYLRAKVVASDFVKICKDDGFSIDEEVVYESDCSKDIQNVKVEDDATLIFTSPSSVKCFLKNNKIKTSNFVIVIGKTTAKALPKGINFIISKETTIESCIKEILNINF
jgi:uroporphyrinogen-III synthase